jgi:hypothetical protein
MNSLTIYHGSEKPIKAVGKNQAKMLDFAYRYQGWHSYSKDRPTLQALNGLLKKGFIEVNQFEQFRFTYPK